MLCCLELISMFQRCFSRMFVMMFGRLSSSNAGHIAKLLLLQIVRT